MKEKQKFGILGGTSFIGSDVTAGWEKYRSFTTHGVCDVLLGDNVAFIARQGADGNLPPHKIDHQCHIYTLKDVGVDRIVSFGSTGGLKPEYAPGTLVVPEDYFSPFRVMTMFEDRLHLTVPEIPEDWRRRVLKALNDAGLSPVDGGVYVETLGPRFETRAEIRWLAGMGDVVGMTCASEATLAREMNIPHCIVAMVDNFAHGIGEAPLSGEEFQKQGVTNRKKVEDAFKAVIEHF